MHKTVKVQDQTIHSITAKGITYINSDDEIVFIDFYECYQNSETKFDFEYRIVGKRNVDADPPYVELFTDPPTRFEFPSVEECNDFRHTLRKHRWQLDKLT